MTRPPARRTTDRWIAVGLIGVAVLGWTTTFTCHTSAAGVAGLAAGSVLVTLAGICIARLAFRDWGRPRREDRP